MLVKYLKYKKKYLELKNQNGGAAASSDEDEILKKLQAEAKKIGIELDGCIKVDKDSIYISLDSVINKYKLTGDDESIIKELHIDLQEITDVSNNRIQKSKNLSTIVREYKNALSRYESTIKFYQQKMDTHIELNKEKEELIIHKQEELKETEMNKIFNYWRIAQVSRDYQKYFEGTKYTSIIYDEELYKIYESTMTLGKSEKFDDIINKMLFYKEAILSNEEAILSNKKAILDTTEATLINKETTLFNKKLILSNKEEILSNEEEISSNKEEIISNIKAMLSNKEEILSNKKAILDTKEAILKIDALRELNKRKINLSIEIDDFIFTLICKSVADTNIAYGIEPHSNDRHLIQYTSRNKKTDKSILLCAYTSVSEMCFWRVATYKGANYLNKYDNYLQSTLLHLKLQEFIWHNFEKIPFIDNTNKDLIEYTNLIDNLEYIIKNLNTLINPYGIIKIPQTNMVHDFNIVGEVGHNKRCKSLLTQADKLTLERKINQQNIQKTIMLEITNAEILNLFLRTIKISPSNVYLLNENPLENKHKYFLPNNITKDYMEKKLDSYITEVFNYDYTYQMRNLISDHFREEYDIISNRPKEYMKYSGEIGGMKIGNVVSILPLEHKKTKKKIDMHICFGIIKTGEIKKGYNILNIVDNDVKINSFGLYETYYSGQINPCLHNETYINYVTKIINYKEPRYVYITNNLDLHNYECFENLKSKKDEIEDLANEHYIFDGYRNNHIFPIKEIIDQDIEADITEEIIEEINPVKILEGDKYMDEIGMYSKKYFLKKLIKN